MADAKRSNARLYVTTILTPELFEQLEQYRRSRSGESAPGLPTHCMSRSDAIRRILSEHLSDQLKSPDRS